MKRIGLLIALIIISILVFEGCGKLGDLFKAKREITYRCINSSGSKAMVSYIGVDGENIFVDVEPHATFNANLDFKKGDWVRIQAQSNANTGTLTVEIRCEGCKNIGKGDDKLSDSVDLSVIKLVEVFTTIE